MKCLFPLSGLRSKKINDATGNRPVVLSLAPKDGFVDQKLSLPCNKCLHCRINRTREFAIRSHHESLVGPSGPISQDNNHFVLLTYNDKNLPKHGALQASDVKKFLDRIRADCAWRGLPSPRTFGCGEYGSKTQRPHYHINIFNLKLSDITYLKNLKQNKLYTSTYLTEKWKLGAVTLSPFSHLTAQYTAKYIVKALWADDPPEGDTRVEAPFPLPSQGRVATSTQPGLGAFFLDRYAQEIVNLGAIEIDGALAPIPTYYKKRLQKKHNDLYKILLQKNYNLIETLRRDEDKTLPSWAALAPDMTRNLVINEVATINQLRKLENET